MRRIFSAARRRSPRANWTTSRAKAGSPPTISTKFSCACGYFAEYDYNADYHYDASGLGRLHRKGAPTAICLSTPGTDAPSYKIDIKDAVPFAIAPEVRLQGEWLSGAAPTAVHKVESHGAQGESAQAQILCRWSEGAEVRSSYSLDQNGLRIELDGENEIGLMLPAFQFDGREKTAIENTGKTLAVTYRGWTCRYHVEDGTICDSGRTGCNRNGHYALFRAEGKKHLAVRIEIIPANNKISE